MEDKCEVGLHGTFQSTISADKMFKYFQQIKEVTKNNSPGIRQHFLRYAMPLTAIIQSKTGLLYDTTLGFPLHEGFRNSYCLPFKLYNFEKDEIINLWEIPLNVMDCTLLSFNKYTYAQAMDSVNMIIEEAQKFNGIFTLLWHNNFFDEIIYPGITDFYKDLLNNIKMKNPNCMLGNEIIKCLNINSN